MGNIKGTKSGEDVVQYSPESVTECVKDNRLGDMLYKARLKKGLSKQRLAELSNVSRQYIGFLESGERQGKTSLNHVMRLINTLSIPPKEVLDGMGYDPVDPPSLEKIHDVERIAIYIEFPHQSGSTSKPVDYVYRAWSSVKTPQNIEGYLVRTDSLSPVVQPGDTIFVDRKGSIEAGDVVACLIDGELHLAFLRRVDNELILENNYKKVKYMDITVAFPVIEVSRKLK